MALRTNLIKNPSFETNITGYTFQSSTTQTRDTTEFQFGAASMKCVVGTGTRAAVYGSTGAAAANADSIAVTAGQSVSFSAYVKVTTTPNQMRAKIHWFNAAGSWIADGDGSIVTPTQNVWTRLSVTFTAPANAAKFGVVLTTAGSCTFYTDGWLAEIGPLDSYFDGSTSGVGYAWTGTAHASTSTADFRENLTKNPSFEAGTKFGWNGSVNNGSTAIDTTSAYLGSNSLKATATGAALRVRGSNGSGQVSEMSAVTPGLTYNVSAYIKSSVSANVQLYAFGANSSGTPTATYLGTTLSVSAGVWTRIDSSFLVVAGDSYIYPNFEITAGASGNTLNIDAVLLTRGNTLGSYFDGSTTAAGYSYAWTGTPSESSSTEVAVTGGTATAALGIGVQAGPVTLGMQAPLGVNAQTGKVSLGVTARLGIDVGVAAVASGPIRTAPLGVDVSAGPTSLGVRAPLGVDVEAGPVALGVTAPLGVDVETEANASVSRTAPLGVAVAAAATANSRTARLSINFDADATWTPPPVAPTRTAALHIGVITPAEAFFTYPPAALGTTPLGKLVSFSVSTSAVPLNPAEGSGATPSVNAAYIKGVDPEFALGESNVLSHGAVGTYEGEIVRLSLPEGSDVASISQDTPMTLLNNEMHLFPFIDAAPSVYTAARAIDYWTQQCGLFLDDVPGDAIAYASGSGHTDSYGAGTTARFYEKLEGGVTSTAVLNNRSVKTLGSAVTGTTAFHELPEGSVSVSVPKNRKLVASIGLGLRGTGRTTTVTWNMLDSRDVAHSLSISATSAGDITASIAGVPLTSTTVAANADYRISFSIERVSDSAVVGKLIVHTDDLDGTGTLEFASASTGFSYAFPAVAYLTDITHVSAGGSGAEMLRWGTYLTVATGHPMTLPAVQKSLAATPKEFGFVSGFEGNVWAMLNEFCAIARLDVSFLDSRMVVASRSSALVPKAKFSRFSYESERRDKYKQVAVVNKQSRAVTTDDAVLWRADSVFQVAAREVFETTVQTGHSILSLVQPVAVLGITPFPYTTGGGQYVVTGADGYIVAPEWWNDNGGKVEVSLTGKEGELAIKITPPAIDTVRAPYRISEGAGDRPALYVAGSGILNDPKEVHVGTGAKNAKEGFDSVFESPFMAGARETYDTAARMAAEYSASVADVGFELANDFYTPSRFGQYPAGTRFTDGKRHYRITSATQTHSKVSGSSVPNTTIGDYVASYPEGSTIADELARHAGRTIKQFNISPLRGTDA